MRKECFLLNYKSKKLLSMAITGSLLAFSGVTSVFADSDDFPWIHYQTFNGIQSIAIYGHNHWDGERGAIVYNPTTGQLGGARVNEAHTALEDVNYFNGVTLVSNETLQTSINEAISKVSEDVTKLKDLSNITDAGKNVIKANARDAVKVVSGDRATVTPSTDASTGTVTYTVSANNNGTVSNSDTNLVSGQTVYNYLHDTTVNLGKDAVTTGDHSIAIGSSSTSPVTDPDSGTTTDETAVTSAAGSAAIAVGSGANASGDGSMALGYGAEATSQYSTAIGSGASSSGDDALAIGGGSDASGTNSIAFGSDAIAKGANSVAIGNKSVADEDNTVAFGNRRLTHVADGTADTDAVNVGQMRTAINKGLSVDNLSADNKESYKKLVKQTISLADADNTRITPVVDSEGNVTYKVHAVVDGHVVDGNTGIVDGGTVYEFVTSTTADKNLSNLTDAGLNVIRKTAANATTVTTDNHLTSSKTVDTEGNVEYKLGVKTDGKAEKGNQGIVSGDTLYEATKDLATNANFNTKASVNMDNLSDKGKNVVRDIAKNSVKVVDGDNTTVTSSTDENGNISYKVHWNADGTLSAGSQEAVSGDTVKKALDLKANVAADNLAGHEIDWAKSLGKGVVADSNAYLITGGAVFDYLHGDNLNLGKNSSAAEYAVAIGGRDEESGNPTKASGRGSVAVGSAAVSAGEESIALGTLSSAAGETSIAIGAGASAEKTNSVAIGAGTIADEENTVAIGNRRLSHVADAVNSDDAVTLKQMQDAIASGTSLTNMSDSNKSAIKDVAQEAVSVTAGDHITVDKAVDSNGNVSYTVSAKSDGKVEAGNTGLVDGNAVHEYVDNTTANKDLSNLTDAAKDNIKKLAGGSISVTGDDHLAINKSTDNAGNTSISIAVKADGKAVAGNTGLVDGNTLYEATKNLATDATLAKKADTDLSNLTDAGKQVIFDTAKDSVKVVDGDNTIVTKSSDSTGAVTYSVHAIADGKIKEGNTGAVSGDTVKKALDTKADIDASNLKGHEEEWGKALGTGSVASGDNHLVTGDTVYHDVSKMIDDTSLVKSSGDTITIGKNDSASTINVGGKNGGRVITGVVTDASDKSSAVNVGYLEETARGLNDSMDSMRHELKNEINDGTAKAGAIAALHPQDYDPDDKMDFAAGFGHYHSSSAAALGAFYHPNENVVVNLGATLGSGEPLVTGGVSLKVGKGNGAIKSRHQLSKEVNSLKQRNKDLEEEVSYLENEMHMVKQMLFSLHVSPTVSKSIPVSTPAEAVSVLHGNGVVKGYPDGKFHGQKKLTRYEYAQMIFNALKNGKDVNILKLNELADKKSDDSSNTPEASNSR